MICVEHVHLHVVSFSEISIRILRAPRQKLRQLRSVSGSFHPHVKSYDSLRLCALWCTPPTNWLAQQAAVGDLLQTFEGAHKMEVQLFRPSPNLDAIV